MWNRCCAPGTGATPVMPRKARGSPGWCAPYWGWSSNPRCWKPSFTSCSPFSGHWDSSICCGADRPDKALKKPAAVLPKTHPEGLTASGIINAALPDRESQNTSLQKEAVNMRSFDFSPLFRSTVGFDRLLDLLDSMPQYETAQTYPPYNIERTDETHYRITLAVAGFAEK